MKKVEVAEVGKVMWWCGGGRGTQDEVDLTKCEKNHEQEKEKNHEEKEKNHEEKKKTYQLVHHL